MNHQIWSCENQPLKSRSFIGKRLRCRTFWWYSCILLLVGSVAQAQPWTPAYLPNGELMNWYDASDITTLWQNIAGTTAVSVSGQTVQRWNDKSGNGNHLTSSSGPAYTTGVMNSLPVLRYNGNIMAKLFPAMGNAADNYTVIGVFKVASNSGWDNWVDWGPSSGYSGQVFVTSGVRPGGPAQAMEFTFGSGTGEDTATAVTGQPAFIFEGSASQTTSLNAQASVWLNGTFQGATNPDSYTVPSSSVTQISLGVSGQTPHGDYAELIVLNTGTNTLADSDRQMIEGYLANKWWGTGASNPLPSGHPYKNSAPTNAVVYNTITATNGVGGTISPAGTNYVAQGQNQIFTIAPLAGYAIANVIVDSVSVGSVTSYTFTNVLANHTIGVNFTALSFFAAPASIVAGGSTVLNWSVTNTATGLTLSPGPGAWTNTGSSFVPPNAAPVYGTTASVVVQPAQTTTYTLSITNGAGVVNQTATVTVGAPPGRSVLPTIFQFGASPPAASSGSAVTLSWSVYGATSLAIYPSIGSVLNQTAIVNGVENGTITVSPSATTTYLLAASNSQGTATATATISIGSQSVKYGNLQGADLGVNASLNGALPFPPDTSDPTSSAATCVINKDISQAPADPMSDAMIAQLIQDSGTNAHVHTGFGLNYVVVGNSQPVVPVNYTLYNGYPGPWPIPPDTLVQQECVNLSQGPIFQINSADRHMAVINRDTGTLYEGYYVFPPATGSTDHSWTFGSPTYPGGGQSNNLAVALSTAQLIANAGGVNTGGSYIFPLFLRYDEASSGVIRHALWMNLGTARQGTTLNPCTTWQSYPPWPANNATLLPNGGRVRLKSSFVIPSGISTEAQAILQALKTYGGITIDGNTGVIPPGTDAYTWGLSGVGDIRWPTALDAELVAAVNINTDFEVVEMNPALIIGAVTIKWPASNNAPVFGINGQSQVIINGVVLTNSNHEIVVGTNALGWNNVAVNIGSGITANSLAFSNNVSNAVFVIEGSTLTLTGPVTITVANGAAAIYAVIAGTNGLTSSGAGTLTITGANPYSGGTTIKSGCLALGSGGSISNTPSISVAGGAIFDVSGLSSFTLGAGQTLSNSTSTATVAGNLNTGAGAVALTYAAGTSSLQITNGTFTLATNTVFSVNNVGTNLTPGSYKLIAKGSGGLVAGTVPATFSMGGGGASSGFALQIIGGELYLNNTNIWLPATLGTNLVNWYDASDTTTLWQDTGGTTAITGNGQSVWRWNDKSGNGNHLTSSSAPIYTTGVMNSLPVLQFAGNKLANTSVSMGSITNNFTVLGVIQVTSNSGWDNWIQWGNGNVGGGDLLVYMDSSARSGGSVGSMEFAYNGGTGAYTAASVTGQPALLFADGVNQATSPSLFSIWKNGTAETSRNPTGVTTHSSSLTQFRIGPSGSSQLPHGNIADLIIVNTGTNTLSNGKRQQIEGYLANKWWGAGTNNPLPSNHPYKNSVPLIVPPIPVLPPNGVSVAGGVVSLTFPTVAGYQYRVDYKNALTDATWQAVAPGFVTSTNGANLTVSDAGAPAQGSRFYRVEAAAP